MLKQFHCVVVECDSAAVVQLLKNLQETGIAETRLLAVINSCIGKFSRVVFVHVYREGNRYADALAAVSFDQEDAYVIFESPPVAIEHLLYKDYVGAPCPRLFTDNGMMMG
ncbi:hypothetical protein QN277_008328 [Acacia crassicarpa]|uniref:RNase H type-1 domain-containing protein n=1 Tax=Acacia crassicarpa TaxID=499986 RepID=A0AAE1IR61_9FABA|nr:hypothetical protein QN277_008328 [Acacia crassicarpa]